MPIEGQRAGAFTVNVERNEQLPAMVERLFQWWRANIDMIPVMNFEELKNGLKSR